MFALAMVMMLPRRRRERASSMLRAAVPVGEPLLQPRRSWLIASLVLLLACGAAAFGYRVKLDSDRAAWTDQLTGGNADHAPSLIKRHGCAG
jgi:hypothetical protein